MCQPFIILAGPTAVGKTALSLAVAEKLNAEIISIDSRQIYKELTIGTAKPSNEELARIPHHFISERSIHHPVSAGQFAALAEERISSILKRGKIPLVVGGSTLYIHALQFGLAAIPEVAPHFRTKLTQRLEEEGPELLYNELEAIDPVAAETMDATKTQRMIRALEVYYGTGHTLSYYHQHPSKPAYSYKTYILHRNRDHLYARINQRVDGMLSEGLVEEVAQLIKDPEITTLPVMRTIGYMEVIEYLQGAYDHDEMVRLIKRNSRRYAKRQLTWFKRFEDYCWLDLDLPSSNHLERICAK